LALGAPGRFLRHHSKAAALIAQGINLGVTTMGHSAEGITADMLQHVSRFFLTERR
jgi:hypothetical protein